LIRKKTNVQSPQKIFENRKVKYIVILFLGVLMIGQILLSLQDIEQNVENMTEEQKQIALNVLGEDLSKDLFAKPDNFSDKNNNSFVMRTPTVSRGQTLENSRPTVTPTPIEQNKTTSNSVQTVSNEELMKGIPASLQKTISKDVVLAVFNTCKMIDLDVRFGKTLVHAESGYNPKGRNVNTGYRTSVDYGLTQINNYGGVIHDYAGKRVDLADGRKQVLVTRENYKTDMYINLMIGLLSYKHYLVDLSGGNPFIAYACYNAGESSYKVFRNYKKANLTADDVILILNRTGVPAFQHASRNIKNNFLVKYNLYFN